jgi:hypothetical protein
MMLSSSTYVTIRSSLASGFIIHVYACHVSCQVCFSFGWVVQLFIFASLSFLMGRYTEYMSIPFLPFIHPCLISSYGCCHHIPYVAGGMTIHQNRIMVQPLVTVLLQPFVHIVLTEKGLDYDLVPTSPESKPRWLIDDYSGKSALHHRYCTVPRFLLPETIIN